MNDKENKRAMILVLSIFGSFLLLVWSLVIAVLCGKGNAIFEWVEAWLVRVFGG
jgi:hypothetical protein